MTSGTSGKPKAIACPTISYAVALAARQERAPYTRAPCTSAASTLDTDMQTAEVEAVNVMFVWEALRPLAYGQTALVVPDEIILDTTRLAPFLAEHHATRILSTPSLLATLLDTSAEVAASVPSASVKSTALAATLSCLRLWLLCGEVVPATLARRAAEAMPQLQLFNYYSSWEGSDVAAAALRPEPTAAKCAPVGSALRGVRCAVLDAESGRPRPRGVIGELYVASPMLFTAYLGAPSLTAERLRPMPAPMLELAGYTEDAAARELAHMHSREVSRASGASMRESPDSAKPTSWEALEHPLFADVRTPEAEHAASERVFLEYSTASNEQRRPRILRV